MHNSQWAWLHHTSEDPDIEEADEVCELSSRVSKVVASKFGYISYLMTHPFSEKEDNGGKGQITGTTWMVDFWSLQKH